jgi:tRNA A37 N6-isopentenylltransferase MiaA
MSSLQNLIACCVYWKCTIVVELGTNVYAKFLCKDYVDDNQTEEDENTVLLYLVKTGGKAAFSKSEAAFNKNKYKFAMETDKQRIIEKLHIMRTSWYKIDHYQKPIRAIGNYGLSDLLEIYNKVCASEDATKMKKQEIYHSIVVKLGTMTVRQFV